MEKKSLVFKRADGKSGEAGSIIEGRMGIYGDGLGNSLGGNKTSSSACTRIVRHTDSNGRGTMESGSAIVTRQPNLSSQRHALAINETDIILKISTRSAAIRPLSLPSCVQL